jgi:hypothetical protein
MKRFIRIGILCSMVFAGAALFCSPFSDAFAGSVKPVVVSSIDYRVGGEPGEDPHLRVQSTMKIQPIRAPEGSGSRSTGGYVVTSGRGILISENGVYEYRIDYSDALWRVLVATLSGVLSR